MQKINLAERFSRITEHWRPKIVAELNGQVVRLVKVRGEFVWHRHAGEDELFYVVRGRLRIDFRDGPVTLGPGEMLVLRVTFMSGRPEYGTLFVTEAVTTPGISRTCSVAFLNHRARTPWSA